MKYLTEIRIQLVLFLSFVFVQLMTAQEYNVSISDIEERAYSRFIKTSAKQDYRYEKNTIINSDSKVDGNVIVLEGDLIVKGRIDGDVLVIDGKVSIRPDATINGNVTSVNGTIFQSSTSVVTGNQIETNVRNLFPPDEWKEDFEDDRLGYHVRNFDRYQIQRSFDSYSTLPLGYRQQKLLLRYNRVEGFFLGLQVPREIGGRFSIFNLYGFGGYAFELDRWQYKVGLNRWLFSQREYRFEIGGEGYDFTDTKDSWIVTPHENSLAAFFIREDFQDYYRKKGFQFYMSQNVTIYLKGTLAYRNDDYESVNRNTNWSLFGGDKRFQENPLIDDGNMRSIYGELYLDTRNDRNLPQQGWYLKLSGETSNSKLGSDFSFNQYTFELRRYQRLSRYERLDFRLKVGSSEGLLPWQKSYELGGLSTLRGFGDKEISALNDPRQQYLGFDRMLLANIEYNINPRILRTGLFLFDDIKYILFFDAGNAWYRSDFSEKEKWYDGFSHLSWDSFKSDFGLAISSWSGKVRLSLARRTDTGVDPFRLIFRISKPF